jgi:hypothetical protein
MIYIFSSKNAADLGLDKKNTWFEILPLVGGILFKGKTRPEINPEDQVYLDISGLSPAELKKNLALLKNSPAFWGIIDPKASAEDPALFFFEGAADYIGPALVKKGLNKKRFAAAFSKFCQGKSPCTAKASIAKKTDDLNISKKKGQKLPGGKFEGWKSIRSGSEGTFFFLFVSLSGKTSLRSLLGEKVFNVTKNRLREILQLELSEVDALLWMEAENNSIFLVPPKQANGKAVIEAALKLVLNSRLIAIEKLGLSNTLEFTLALHYGKTIFQAPGKTGAVISESLNYIFHLGAKKAETGRLTISDDVPEEALPNGLKDLFTPAGVFEGTGIRHSKRFFS